MAIETIVKLGDANNLTEFKECKCDSLASPLLSDMRQFLPALDDCQRLPAKRVVHASFFWLLGLGLDQGAAGNGQRQ